MQLLDPKPEIQKLPCGCISQIWECPNTGLSISGMDLCKFHERKLREMGGHPIEEEEAN